MQIVGFPRGEIAGVSIVPLREGVRGRKRSTCTIEIDQGYITEMLGSRGTPDGIFKVWVHESLHARQPFATLRERFSEYPVYEGYEEGLVEGIARWMIHSLAGMEYVSAYSRHVHAYESLAQVLEADITTIWRCLYRHPFGRVREAFPQEIGTLWYNRIRQGLAREQLQRIADRLFSVHQRMPPYSDADLAALWKEALND
jgi:hypothetical protein